MNERYTKTLEDVKAKLQTIIEEQLIPLQTKLIELKNDKVLEGELLYCAEEDADALNDYKNDINLIEEAVSNSIDWMAGNLEIVNGKDWQ